MAMRESTGLQIALILFVMITVVLAVTTYFSFQSASTSDQAAKTMEEKLNKANTAREGVLLENEELRGMLGYQMVVKGGPAIDEIKKNKVADMAKFGPGYPEENRNYRNLVSYQDTQLVAKNAELAAEKENLAKKDEELALARQREQNAIKQHDDEYQLAFKSFQKEVADVKGSQQITASTNNDIQKKLEASSRQALVDKANLEKEKEAYVQQTEKLQRQNKILIDKIAAEQNPAAVGAAERPDGKITWVNQRGGNVYVNLGSADGLQRSTRFTVYDAGTVNLSQSDPKASIEVTTIRGAHLAQARIVEDTLSDPILTDDNVYSPVWNPGQKTHFALVGFMDIDKDGKSDRQLVRGLIAQNGGVVDAEVLDDGTWEGKLTVNTRYLVQGERANEKTATAVRQTASRMFREADSLGVEKMSIERLLSDMGWRGSERTVGAGTEATGGEFKAVPKESGGNGGFQPRTRPGATRRGSAY